MNVTEIAITLDISDDAMIGSGSWDGLNPQETVSAYASEVREALQALFPDAELTVDWSAHIYTTKIEVTEMSGLDAHEKALEMVGDALQGVYERGTFWK